MPARRPRDDGIRPLHTARWCSATAAPHFAEPGVGTAPSPRASDPRLRTSRPQIAGWYFAARRTNFPGRVSMRLFSKLALSFLLAANVARAQSNDAPAKADASKPADESAAAPEKTDAAQSRPYVDSAITFLTSLTHTNRSGDAGAKAWADLRSVSVDKIPIKWAGKDLVIDAQGGHSDAMLVRFSKVSTWREAYDVQGVNIEKAQIRVGDQDYTGKPRLKLAEKNGKRIVEPLEAEEG